MKSAVSMKPSWMVFLAACALLAACGGGSESPVVTEGDTRAAGALVPARTGELLDYVKTMLAKRQQQLLLNTSAADLAPVLLPTSSVTAGATAVTAATYSSTTVQEAGVDEDDLLKTDGSLLVSLAPVQAVGTEAAAGEVRLHRRRADGGLDALARVTLPGESETSSFVEGLHYAPAAGRVVALGNAQTLITTGDVCAVGKCGAPTVLPAPIVYVKQAVLIDRIDVTNPAAPVRGERIKIDGRLIGSRRVGNRLAVVMQHSPQLPFEVLPASTPPGEREAQVAQLQANDLLPTITIDGADPRPLLEETDCLLQPANASLGIDITIVTVLDLADGGPIDSRCFAGGVEALYMSSTNLYLATTRYGYDIATTLPSFAPATKTDIHKFALGGTKIDYRGSGEVAGHLGWDLQKRSYRMSEQGGFLRVLTYTGVTGWGTAPDATAPSPALLSILRESNTVKRLDLVARLPNDSRPQPLGKPGEQVYAVRFVGDRGYVVTFRRIDPLYVLDLSNPSDPKAVGELLTAGFSDYLFPIDGGLLFGVGRDATEDGRVTGIKVALFDVSDAARPREVAARVFGSVGSASGLDLSRHGVNFHARAGVVRVGLPLYEQYVGTDVPPARRGLQRFEIDPTTRSLATLSMVPPATASSPFSLGSDRSVQIDDHVYYLSDGEIRAAAW